MIALAEDLQKDFYDLYFPEFLSIIIDLLQTKDADQLEYTFTVLAYLFKSLGKYMKKNIGFVFNLLVPLLADTKPKYINNFAAESFAFVVRKIKNKEEFFKQVIETIEEKKIGVEGCGKLLFYVLAGVRGQFHSCAEDILGVYFTALEDSSLNQDLLFEVLSVILNCVSNEIHPQKCDVLWTVIYNKIDNLSENCLINFIKLLQLVINYRDGKLIQNSAVWSKKLVQLIDKHKENHLLLEEISNLVVASLCASNIKFLQETLSFLIIKLLSVDDEDLLLEITEKLIPCQFFESMILPKIIEKKIFSVLNAKTLHLLAKIIEIKSPPILSGMNFDKWRRFSLKVRCDKNSDNYKFLSQYLDSLREGEIKENALYVLIILPHLTSWEVFYENMKTYLSFLFERVSKNSDHQQKINFAFLLIMECMAHLASTPDEFLSSIEECFNSEFDIFSASVLHNDDIFILNTLDLCLNQIKNSSKVENYINQVNFDKLHESLAPQLGELFLSKM